MDTYNQGMRLSRAAAPVAKPLGGSVLALDPMYFTDEYPRDGLSLVVDVRANGAFWLRVYHPDRDSPLESYPCGDESMLHKRMAEWLSRHLAEVTS